MHVNDELLRHHSWLGAVTFLFYHIYYERFKHVALSWLMLAAHVLFVTGYL